MNYYRTKNELQFKYLGELQTKSMGSLYNIVILHRIHDMIRILHNILQTISSYDFE